MWRHLTTTATATRTRDEEGKSGALNHARQFAHPAELPYHSVPACPAVSCFSEALNTTCHARDDLKKPPNKPCAEEYIMPPLSLNTALAPPAPTITPLHVNKSDAAPQPTVPRHLTGPPRCASHKTRLTPHRATLKIHLLRTAHAALPNHRNFTKRVIISPGNTGKPPPRTAGTPRACQSRASRSAGSAGRPRRRAPSSPRRPRRRDPPPPARGRRGSRRTRP